MVRLVIEIDSVSRAIWTKVIRLYILELELCVEDEEIIKVLKDFRP